MQIIKVEYDCCGAAYTVPAKIREDEFVYAYSTVALQVVEDADAKHRVEHPGCPDA